MLLFEVAIILLCSCVIMFEVAIILLCTCVIMFHVAIIFLCFSVILFEVAIILLRFCVILFEVAIILLCFCVILFEVAIILLCSCVIMFQVAIIFLCFCVILFQVKSCNPKNCETGQKHWEWKGFKLKASTQRSCLPLCYFLHGDEAARDGGVQGLLTVGQQSQTRVSRNVGLWVAVKQPPQYTGVLSPCQSSWGHCWTFGVIGNL